MIVLTAQSAWSHSGNNSSTVVHACIFKTAKFVRIVDVNDHCKGHEIATHWNIQGAKGDSGLQGIQGADGSQGAQGTAGIQGVQGLKGDDGKSAYQLALDSGYVGELADWLGSLNGTDGQDGVNGNDGSQGMAGINGIQGPKGDTGTQGIQGEKGEKGDVGVIEPGVCIQDDLTGRWVVFATQGNNDVRFTIDIDAKGTLTGTNLYTDSTKIPKDGELAGDLMMSENKESECFIKLSVSNVGSESVNILMEGVISPDHHSIIGGGIDSINGPSLLTNLRAIRVSPKA
jgi:hypothetical protein